MWRAQPNAFDDLVAKATDENLTSEPWGEIMNVCDKVNESESGPKDAIQALIKRLNHRNANVQLYALELANALSQNCGINLHRELASRSFTEALLRLAGERNTHPKVKAKILERMGDWAEMFSSNPELGIMEQNYMKLKTQNPHLQPPSQPPKTLITDSDRRREEEELQMALELSIKEKDRPAANVAQAGPAGNSQTASQAQTAPQSIQPVPTGTTAATVSRVRALYDFNPTEAGELQFRKGDIISVVESVYKDWWRGSLHGQTGIFPLNYVEKLQDPTQEELEREAHMEAEVFGEIKNVEKLLALLSTSAESGKGDVRDNEEITTLYQSTVAIRPKLIELIGKYSQKKDDFTQLNEKFIKARRDYEALLEASMSQPPQGYGRPSYSSYGGGASGYGAGYGQQNSQSYYTGAPTDPPAGYPPQQAHPQQQAQPNGPQPFYFMPPSQQGQSQGQPSYPHAGDNSSADDLYAAPPPRTNTQQQQRPQSLAYDPRQSSAAQQQAQAAGPSELASTSYDSPVGQSHRPSSPYSAPQQQQAKPSQQPGQQLGQGVYSQASSSSQRLPSDPYSWSATSGPAAQGQAPGRPNGGSPVEQQPAGYPPQAGGSAAGYPGYQSYHSTREGAGWAGAPA